jgi:PKHD-type hydroxylase
MILKNYYWYFKSALSNKLCDEIIKTGNARKEQTALTGEQEEIIKERKKLNKKDFDKLRKIRNSDIAWLNDQWIYREIHPYIHDANKNAGWNYDWDWSESCQFTKYKLNQFYDWHSDSFSDVYNNPNNPNFNGKIRKLSVTCSLSDPKDYKGGELEFDLRNNKNGKPVIVKCKEILPRGSIVVFPSFLWHRVKPVTKGTRYSLVIWNLGYPYR